MNPEWMELVTEKEVCGEDFRKFNPHNCPVRLRTCEGVNVGACWHYLEDGKCPVHGQIYEFEAKRMAACDCETFKEITAVGAEWRKLAMRLADEAIEVLDNAHLEVKHGSGDLRKTIKAVREKYRLETETHHRRAAKRLWKDKAK